MKKLTVKKDVPCMACLECVRACSVTFYKEFNEDYSCIRIVAKEGGAKPNVCIQCGKCAKVCEKVMVLKPENPASKCISCGACVKACPMGVLEIVEK